MIEWMDFKVEKPYDYRTDSNIEDDPEYCIFVYKRKEPNNYVGICHIPTLFIDGKFEGWNEIEILYWYPYEKIKQFLVADFNSKRYEISLNKSSILRIGSCIT